MASSFPYAPPLPPQPSSAPSQHLMDLDLTIVSAKHLKNVNWKQGELKPYAVFWIESDRKMATKPDDCGSTRPVWNERFTIPIPVPFPLEDDCLLLSVDVFHSKPSETPKPLVGSLRHSLRDLLHGVAISHSCVRNFELHRPSGRPQGKVRLRIELRERPLPPPPYSHRHRHPHHHPHQVPPFPDYHHISTTPPPSPSLPSSYYYSSSAPSPPPPSSASSPYEIATPPAYPPYHPYASYSDPYSGYHPCHYPPRPFFERGTSVSSIIYGPSAPMDFSTHASLQDQKRKGVLRGTGSVLAVGSIAGALGGLALEEGLKHEEDKIAERADRDLTNQDDYSDYRVDYGRE